MLDVLIVGGGPVGLATALYAHRAGLSATVLEPRSGPIDKACGEGLMPGAVQALAELGVNPAGMAFRGIRYVDGPASAEALFRHGAAGRGVRRTTLQHELGATVAARGIPVLATRVTGFDRCEAGIRVGELTARYLVGADGLHSQIRTLAGLSAPSRSTKRSDGPNRWGLRCHVELAPWTDLVEVHWARTAEAYVTPVASDQVGIAILTSRPGSFEEQLAQFPALQGRIGDAAVVTSVRGAGPLRQRSTGRVSGNVLLAGDAAGYVDALTGEGIAVGLASARQLIDCLVTGNPESYERRWRSASRRHRSLTGALLWTSRRPALRRRLVPTAARAPWVFGAIVDQLAR